MRINTLFLLGATLLASCMFDEHNQTPNLASRINEPAVEPSPAPPGAALFAEKCAMCHRQHGMGTGLLSRRLPQDQALLENRTDLTSGLIQAAVRQGIGTMPRISRAEVSDAQLHEIERHLIRQPAAADHAGAG